jgi:DNA-binding FadR family transcriptional regulator
VVRLLLEATTVRLAALNISQEQQDHLFTILEQTKNLLTLDNKFPTWKLYECMGRQPDLLQSSLAREYKEHTAVVNAITSHNLDMAVRQAIKHVQNVGKEIVTFLEVPNSLLEKREQQIMSLLRMKSKKESAA